MSLIVSGSKRVAEFDREVPKKIKSTPDDASESSSVLNGRDVDIGFDDAVDDRDIYEIFQKFNEYRKADLDSSHRKLPSGGYVTQMKLQDEEISCFCEKEFFSNHDRLIVKEILDFEKINKIPPYVISRTAIAMLKNAANNNMGLCYNDEKKRSVYTHQIILDLGSGYTSKALEGKRAFVHGKESYIYDTDKIAKLQMAIEDEETDNDVYKEFESIVTLSSRIYIIGHCAPDSKSMDTDKNDFPLSVRNIVDLLSPLKHLQVQDVNTEQDNILNISLVGCNSTNMAKKLGEALKKVNVPAKVSGRQTLQRRAMCFAGYYSNFFKVVDHNASSWHKAFKETFFSYNNKPSVQYPPV